MVYLFFDAVSIRIVIYSVSECYRQVSKLLVGNVFVMRLHTGERDVANPRAYQMHPDVETA